MTKRKVHGSLGICTGKRAMSKAADTAGKHWHMQRADSAGQSGVGDRR